MTGWGLTPELLNAYVDGELSAAERALIARASADDPEIAERIAQLSRLKAALHESVQDAAGRQSITLPHQPAGWPRRQVLAAALALAAFLGGAALLQIWQAGGGPAMLAQARSLHDAWQRQEAEVPAVGDGAVLAALNELGPAALLPDLSAAQLILNHVMLRHRAAGPALLHAGYSGTRGCRVSLFLTKALAGVPRDLTLYKDGIERTYAWRSGGLGYLLLASGMDDARFDLIARSVHSATLEARPFGSETRAALAESRAASTPCLS
ncbi:MAG: anti-sigma factor family protein [Kiloniellales bacterium]